MDDQAPTRTTHLLPATVEISHAARLLGITRREVERRMADLADRRHLAWTDRKPVDGKRGRLVLVKGLDANATERLAQELRGGGIGDVIREIVRETEVRSQESEVRSQKSAQKQFGFAVVPEEIRRAVAALEIPPEQAALVQFRKEFVTESANHKWREQDYSTKGAWIKDEIAKAHAAGIRRISRSSIYRWNRDYARLGIKGLMDLPTGPRPAIAGLELWQSSYIEDCFLRGMGMSQSYRAVLAETRLRQAGCGLDYRYPVPTYWAVQRLKAKMESLAEASANANPEAVKTAIGYCDRSYAHLESLGCVECDEWKFNLWAFDAQRPLTVVRYWLLVFYDLRSMYPLAWKIVRGSDSETRHGISENDEIDLTERLVREYGVPHQLSSDRGRFRGNTWGGTPTGKERDEKFSRSDGILDALGITYNKPRESNPRAMRLHPFFKYLSDECRGVPGYIGRNTVERKATHGDEDKAEHIEWARGNCGGRPPCLMSSTQLAAWVGERITWWREHPSEGTDMRGLSPRAVFVHNTPSQGFTQLSEEDFAIKFAETFPDELIECGGIVTLPDKSRYSSPLLTLIPKGELRTVKRFRHEKNFIVVLPTRSDDEAIIADRRGRYGADTEATGAEIERQKHMRKVVAEFYGKQESSAGGQVSGQNSEFRIPNPDSSSISSVEWQAERIHISPPVAAMDLTEDPFAAERSTPELHEMEAFDLTMEEM
jgi:hypothetical protein